MRRMHQSCLADARRRCLVYIDCLPFKARGLLQNCYEMAYMLVPRSLSIIWVYRPDEEVSKLKHDCWRWLTIGGAE